MRSRKSFQSINDKATINVFREKLLQWTCERHATNQPLNREILADKIIDLSNQLGLGNFKCAKSWTTRFLKKHGFSPSLTSPHGPIFDDYKDWIDLMRSYITRYRYKNVFQVDEMGMYHDMSPKKIRQSVDCLTCKNGEYKESRVTVLLCCNASGNEKLPPVICGKFENRLPPDKNYQYYMNQNAWLTSDIFKVWLSQLNTQMSQLNRKILLLLNRTRVHTLKDAVLSNVGLMFLPKEFPPNLQPLRANIFHYVKMMYRRSYTKKILEPNFNWTLTDTINGIVNSWDGVPKEFILSSFRRTNFRSDNNLLEISCPEWEKLNLGVPFKSYVTFDDNLCVSSSSNRMSKRLAEIKTSGSSLKRFSQRDTHDGGYDEPIELGDSDSDDIVVEKVLHTPKMSEFGSSLSVVNSYEYFSDGLRRRKNREIDKARYSETEVRDSDPKNSQCSKEDRFFDSTDSTYSASPPNLATTILYVSDTVKNAIGKFVDNLPDGVDVTSGFESQVGTGDVINRRLVEEDDETVSIRRKRRREETKEKNLPNDESLEQSKKRIVEEEVWSDIYEHSFVFGVPESPQASTSASTDVQMVLLQPKINSIEKNDDPEKKSIFTISQASSSRSQNQ